MKLLCIVFGLMGAICLLSTQEDTSKSLPIIDMHMHAYPAEYMGEVSVPNPVTGKPSAATSDEELMLATLKEMRRYNIVKAVASGPLEIVLRWKSAEPKRIIAGVYFDEVTSLPDLERLRQHFMAGQLGVLGELVAQHVGLSLADPLFEPYLNLAEELDIPVGIHTGLGPEGTPYTCCPKFRVTYGNPVLLEEVLIRHPKLRLYIMHGGWPYLEETKAIMAIYPQVYADLATINWIIPREEFHEYLRGLIRAGLGKRIMFGSDQMVWPEAIGMAIEGIESAQFLSKEQKRDIFYNNAVRFLRLKEKGEEK
ncbi:MAG: amidohydrolase family protein [Candidatus Aminicenantes bacterium]|nr:amidohydrolase family protein [Candidatus Aminicenantes bacterium]